MVSNNGASWERPLLSIRRSTLPWRPATATRSSLQLPNPAHEIKFAPLQGAEGLHRLARASEERVDLDEIAIKMRHRFQLPQDQAEVVQKPHHVVQKLLIAVDAIEMALKLHPKACLQQGAEPEQNLILGALHVDLDHVRRGRFASVIELVIADAFDLFDLLDPERRERWSIFEAPRHWAAAATCTPD